MNSTLLKSEERTATTSTLDQTSSGSQRGVLLVLDVTKAPAAADTLTVSIEVRDPATGKYVPLTAFAASKKGEELEAGATLAFSLYPGALETGALAGHEVMGLALPSAWRAKVTHSAGGKWTYTLGALALR
jgi:hypothetical protein